MHMQFYIKMRRNCSDRAIKLVKKARLFHQNELPAFSSGQNNLSSPSRCSRSIPAESSPFPSSPLPPWWDDVFEATDISRMKLCSSRNSESVKRKLFEDSSKDTTESRKETFASIHDSSSKFERGSNNAMLSDKENESLVDFQVHNKFFEGVFNEVSTGQSRIPDVSRKPSNVINANPSLENIIHSGTVILPKLSGCQTDNAIQENVRKLYPSHFKIFEAKLSLNSGKEHMTTKGKLRQARDVKLPCQENCKRCLNPRLTQEERLNLNKEFWNLKDHEKQWDFIRNSLILSIPKKKFVVSGAKGGKQASRTYMFSIEGNLRKVCKTMFKSTLCICDSWIDSAIAHSLGSSGDRRGKHKRF